MIYKKHEKHNFYFIDGWVDEKYMKRNGSADNERNVTRSGWNTFKKNLI